MDLAPKNSNQVAVSQTDDNLSEPDSETAYLYVLEIFATSEVEPTGSPRGRMRNCGTAIMSESGADIRAVVGS